MRNAPPHDHAVHVYGNDLAIDQEVLRFIEDGLTLGENVIVAADAEHCASIAAWRSENPPNGDSDALHVVDAAETLQAFMAAGIPDPALFEATVGALVERAVHGGRRVRIFGEMVALLWADGNVVGALALESLWNEMASRRQFFLLCGYPEGLLHTASLSSVNSMCDRHSNLSLLGYQEQFADAATATPPCASRLLIPIPTAVPAARKVATRTLVDWGLPHLIEKCVLITAELAANAVRHADSSFRLILSHDTTHLRVAVEDAVAHMPAANRSGLARIESIASTWGWDMTADGKAEWAELRI